MAMAPSSPVSEVSGVRDPRSLAQMPLCEQGSSGSDAQACSPGGQSGRTSTVRVMLAAGPDGTAGSETCV